MLKVSLEKLKNSEGSNYLLSLPYTTLIKRSLRVGGYWRPISQIRYTLEHNTCIALSLFPFVEGDVRGIVPNRIGSTRTRTATEWNYFF